MRRYRSHGPQGPGVSPQCVPGGDERPHLLPWSGARAPDASLPPLVPLPLLTQSELEVLLDAADGLTVRDSARKRHKSGETVKSQRRQVLLKLGARNMTHAVALAAAAGRISRSKAA
jgi:DNA-binding NarL/FixJ family response regulator